MTDRRPPFLSGRRPRVIAHRGFAPGAEGNTLESWEPSPWTHAPNANVADQKAMTSAQAQAARAKSAEVMAALKKGEPGDADRLLVSEFSCSCENGWQGDREWC